MRIMIVAFCLSWAASIPAHAEEKPLQHRWVYLVTNLLVDKNVDEGIAIMKRAAKAGYNGVVVTDSKFMRWGTLPDRYEANVRRFRQAARDERLAVIAAVCPMGYANDLLSRDPNLAEGLPVVDAPFIARDGRLVPADDSAQLVNGDFEKSKNNTPTGWSFVDMPGKLAFIDTKEKLHGQASLRMEDIGRNNPPHGNGRVCQRIAVKPFRYYHVSAAVKTQNFESVGDTRIAVIAKDGAMLNHHEPKIEKTQPWRRIDITFNSLNVSEVNLYLGTWGGKGGRIWWDDVRLEPAGLVNVVRRDHAPLRATSDDGKTVYAEGRDFQNALDAKLGVVPWPGGFNAWHDPPFPTIPAGSRIRNGGTVRLSYYHTAIVHAEQVMCCMAEPKVYEILKWQVEQVHKHLSPDGYFLQHDEIRVQGWDESCKRSGKTPGQLLAENVSRCADLVRREDAGKPIYVWSDMFDPFHNAKKSGQYYLVKGDGPWSGSWDGLAKDIVVVNWNSMRDKRVDSLRHFADRGHGQILAGYYDGPVGAIRGWLDDARSTPGLAGVMYTTWKHDYTNLERFAEQLKNAD